jgi:hypothetical protein
MFETDDGLQLKAFNLRDVLGKTIECEDGVKRRVEQISYSERYADKVLINEIIEDETPGGAWVHVLSLSCQMLGKPLPTPEQKRAATRVFSSMRFRPEDKIVGKDRDMVELPSGLVVRRGDA